MDRSESERVEVDLNCCNCTSKTQGRAFVGFVSFLIFSVWTTWWASYAYPWMVWTSNFGIFHCLFFNSAVFLATVCYYRTVTTPPGYASSNYIPPNFSEAKLEEFKTAPKPAKRTVVPPETPKWCPHCQHFKPPRTSHCKELNACVLRMDHFCPWVDNCVGYRNHKSFMLFLIYSIFGLTDFLITFFFRLVWDLAHDPSVFRPFDIVFFLYHFMITVPMTIMIFGLCVFQISCVLENCTSMEARCYDNYKWHYKRQRVKFIWIYDKGYVANLRDFFGPNMSEWFLPSVPLHIQEGDGITYYSRTFPTPAPLDPKEKDTADVCIDVGEESSVKRKFTEKS